MDRGNKVLKCSTGSILAALKHCSISRDLKLGRKVHNEALMAGNYSDVFVATSLVNMYAKCGSMVEAANVFRSLQGPSVATWNCLIMGYAVNGDHDVALTYYHRMTEEHGLQPSSVTLVAALKACTSLAEAETGSLVGNTMLKTRSLEKGKAIHLQAAGRINIFVQNSLMAMYVKCGSLPDARQVFDNMKEKNTVCWTTIVMGYAQNGEPEIALELFSEMQKSSVELAAMTLVAVFKACGQLADKEMGDLVNGKLVKVRTLKKTKEIHYEAEEKGLVNRYVASSLIDTYAKCREMVEASKVFEAMDKHDIVSWTSIITGHLYSGEACLALMAFEKMQEHGLRPDAVTFMAALKACATLAEVEEGKTSSLDKVRAIHSQAVKGGYDRDTFLASTLVDVYAKCGSMVDAETVFQSMTQHDKVSWTALIRGYSQCGAEKQALDTYNNMKSYGILPDTVSFIEALKACGSLAALEEGRKIHADICEAKLESDSRLGSVLIEFYGRCGSMKDAEQAFQDIPKKNLVVFSSLMGGYSREGNSDRVIQLFDMMVDVEKLVPNEIVFASLLTACSHAGLVDKGKEYFKSMSSVYGISPEIEHYTCIVDLLGRANRLEEAATMVLDMPHEPDNVVWTALLAGAHKWKNLSVGTLAFVKLLKLDDKNPVAYVLMADICSKVDNAY